jgi:hypothetical protein
MRVHSVRRAASAAAAILLALLHSSCVAVYRGAQPTGRDSLHGDLTKVLNLRIHGLDDETSPPILRIAEHGKAPTGMGNDALTLEFEVQTPVPPNVSLLLVHCDRNWVPTDNIFVQDPIHLKTSEFTFERAPIGVTHYDYVGKVNFPEAGGRLSIEFSGNYLARIVDYYDNSRVLAETRFFVVESKAKVSVGLYSDFYESAQTDVLQHGNKLRVEAEPNYDVFGGQINAIEVYRAWQWYSPLIASSESDDARRDRGDPWIRWYPAFGGKSVAEYGNLPSGNEHRILDLTDLIYYPTTGTLMTTPLSDLPRREFTLWDNNGASISRLVPFSDADYVYFEFRLDLKGGIAKEDIFVVGSFNNWRVTPEWRMNYDKTTGFYTARGFIRRAVHEYEYVAGKWNEETGVLKGAEATLIEGNLTATTLPYFAFVYYHETSSGGYDRIVGVGMDISGNR